MPRSLCISILLLAAGTFGAGYAATATAGGATPAAVTQQRMESADDDPGQWMSHGRTSSGQRFSPLK